MSAPSPTQHVMNVARTAAKAKTMALLAPVIAVAVVVGLLVMMVAGIGGGQSGVYAAAIGGSLPPNQRAYALFGEEGIGAFLEATAETDVPWYLVAGLTSWLTKNGQTSPYPGDPGGRQEREHRWPEVTPPVKYDPSDNHLGWERGGCGPYLLNPHPSAASVSYVRPGEVDRSELMTEQTRNRLDGETPDPTGPAATCDTWGEQIAPWIDHREAVDFNPQNQLHSLHYIVAALDAAIDGTHLADQDWLDEHDPQGLRITNPDAQIRNLYAAAVDEVLHYGYTERWEDADGSGDCSDWENGIYGPLRLEQGEPIAFILECPAPPLVPQPGWTPPDPPEDPDADWTPPDPPLVRDYGYIPVFGPPDFATSVVNEALGLIAASDGSALVGGNGSLAGVAGISPEAAAAYENAISKIHTTQPQCLITVEFLAAFGHVESRHGTYRGASIAPNGDVRLPDGGYIMGVALNGGPGLAAIKVGRWANLWGQGSADDWARAMGPMQFIPGTWQGMIDRGHADGNGDGDGDPHNYFDATFAAANLLCEGRTLATEAEMRAAALGYNHSSDYADEVMAKMLEIRAQMSTGGMMPTNPSDVSAPVPLVDVVCPGGGRITVNAAIGHQVAALLSASQTDGLNLCGGGYRDAAGQIAVRRSNCGTSHYAIWEMPANSCRPPTARPGTSMHERGLAIDFTNAGQGNCSTRSTACFRWLAENAALYGLKNLPSEPWHWSTTGG